MSNLIVPNLKSSIRASRSTDASRKRTYSRKWDLPRLLAIWPHEMDDAIASREAIVEKLRKALRAERQRGVGGHWTYDVSRHAQLVAAFRAETAELAARRSESIPAARSAGAGDRSRARGAGG